MSFPAFYFYCNIIITIICATCALDAVDLSGIADFVKCNCNSLIPLLKPRGYTLRICGLDGTVFEGDEEQLEAWKDFYLPESMEMEVIGAIDEFPCDAFGLQLVLLLGEDGSVFAYEDESLHLVAKSLRDLFQCEMVFPGIKTFKIGEYFDEPVRSYTYIMHLYSYVYTYYTYIHMKKKFILSDIHVVCLMSPMTVILNKTKVKLIVTSLSKSQNSCL